MVSVAGTGRDGIGTRATRAGTGRGSWGAAASHLFAPPPTVPRCMTFAPTTSGARRLSAARRCRHPRGRVPAPIIIVPRALPRWCPRRHTLLRTPAGLRPLRWRGNEPSFHGGFGVYGEIPADLAAGNGGGVRYPRRACCSGPDARPACCDLRGCCAFCRHRGPSSFSIPDVGHSPKATIARRHAGEAAAWSSRQARTFRSCTVRCSFRVHLSAASQNLGYMSASIQRSFSTYRWVSLAYPKTTIASRFVLAYLHLHPEQCTSSHLIGTKVYRYTSFSPSQGLSRSSFSSPTSTAPHRLFSSTFSSSSLPRRIRRPSPCRRLDSSHHTGRRLP
jgi:hypothetical protein